MVIELAITLLIHFILGWPVWLSLVIAHLIWSLIDWVIAPFGRVKMHPLANILLSLVTVIPIYFLIVLVLYLIGHPSW
jgi:hypothetical protein